MAASLIDLLHDLEDPRDSRGVQYPLVPVLALCLVAILAGHTSLAAIAQFGRLRGRRLGHALGFPSKKMPAATTLSLLLRQLDADHLDRIIGAWLAGRHAAGWDHIAIDGKVLRGSRDGDVPGVHLLAAYAPQAAAVLGQLRVAATTNEHKAALRLLGVLPPLGGAVVTADAMFTHRDVAAQVLEKQGEYVLYAKDNQETLLGDVAAAFAAADSGGLSPPAPAAVAGRRADGRDARQGARAVRDADPDDDDVAERVLGLAAGRSGLPAGAGASGEGPDDGRSGVRDYQPDARPSGRGPAAGPDAGALGHRERPPLHAGRDAAGGPVPRPERPRPAGAGVAAERGRPRAARNGAAEHGGRRPGTRGRPTAGPRLPA